MSKIKKLFFHPFIFFKDAAEKRKKKMERIYIFGFSTWKTYLRRYFPENKLIFIEKDIALQKFNLIYKNEIIEQKKTCQVFIWGLKSPDYILKFLSDHQIKTKFVEDGFVRSVQLGATKTPPMSLCLDSVTPYFDATKASELETLLSTFDFKGKDDLLKRSKEGIELLCKTGVSKYNNSAPVDVTKFYGAKSKTRILVLGQVEDDASILFGCQKRLTNNDVVRLAVKENPDAQVIYKPHPDVINGHRPYQSNPRDVADISTLITNDVPLANAFETVDHVYTITSLGGFEALLRGIKVTVLGCPFYAGWGLTDDRQPNERRTRKLTIEQLFAVAYLIYPKYFEPECGKSLTFEDVVTRISTSILEGAEETSISFYTGRGSVSEVMAVKGLVESGYQKYGDNWSDEKLPIAILFCFQHWRWPQTPPFFENYRLLFKPINSQANVLIDVDSIKNTLLGNLNSVIVIWGMNKFLSLEKLVVHINRKIIRVEEGFIRGVSLGANLAPPLSMAIDDVGMYFNSTSPSLLENLLNTYDFNSDQELHERSRNCIARLLYNDISKYNYTSKSESYYGEKTKKRILVLGQVEDDSSIEYGCAKRIDNNGLVMLAALENPDADIYYKPHPDTLRGNRRLLSDPKDVESVCTIIYEPISLNTAFEQVDHVYTITSLSGFEALLRGIKVTTFGAPFYSGWGVTDDRQHVIRRTRSLSVENIFAAAYILYMKYRHPITGSNIEVEEAISIMDWVRGKNVSLIPKFYKSVYVGSRFFSISKKRVAENRFEEAAEEINRAIKFYPDDYRYYLHRIEINEALGHGSLAIKNDYHKIVEIAPVSEKPFFLKQFIKYLWKVEGVTKELRAILSLLMAHKVKFKANDYMWLAALYYDAGYYTRAFDFFVQAHEMDPKITRSNTYLALSNFISKHDPSLLYNHEAVSNLYNKIERSKGAFDSMIASANKVAIVGNSPVELGKGVGQIIDSHDVVIRFNNFSTSSEFSNDYGKKTDIWVKAGYFDLMSRRNVDEFKLIVQPMGDMIYRDPNGAAYVADYIDKSCNVEFIDPTVLYELYNILGSQPSSGVIILYCIYKLKGRIPRDSVFGFSFVDQESGSTGYTYRVKAGRFNHNWKSELDLFNKIVG